MGKRGNFKVKARKVGDVAIIVSNHETIHVFTKYTASYHTIYHRWFAIRGTWANWCEFIKFLFESDESEINIGRIGEVAHTLNITVQSTSRPLIIDGKVRNYETEDE